MKKILYGILFFLLFFGLIKWLLPNIEDTPCKLQEKFLKLEINGIVEKKYIDNYEHSYPIIELKDTNVDTILKINLVLEETGVFNKINRLDFLYKPKGNDTIFVMKDHKLKMIGKVSFGCNE